MNAPEMIRSSGLADVQSAPDLRHLAIQRVGVKGLRHPLSVKCAGRPPQPTIGVWSLDVELPETQKGTHMSRFVALIEDHAEPLDVAGLRVLLREMVRLLEVRAGRIEVTYPFFIRKSAPVSGVTSLMDYEVRLIGEIAANETHVWLTVIVPVTSLCPCSKEVSDYGAHNQRSHVTIQVELVGDMTAEDLVLMAEQEASCQLYGLLKRPDEKFVTEQAYDNPKFVEDLVRDVVRRLQRDARVGRYVVEVENFESIHNHSAYARIEGQAEAPAS